MTSINEKIDTKEDNDTNAIVDDRERSPAGGRYVKVMQKHLIPIYNLD